MNTAGAHTAPATVCEPSRSQAKRRARGRKAVETPTGALLAECLAGCTLEPTIIVDGKGPHRFTRLFRAPSVGDAGTALLNRTVHDRSPNSGTIAGMLTQCAPILGPSGAVHAIRMDFGATSSSDVLPVVPLEFDARHIVRFGQPDGPVPALFGIGAAWTLPALLEKVAWLDKRLEFIAMFDPMEPAQRWCESLVVYDPAAKTEHHLWMAARSATDDSGTRVVRCIIADITALAPPPNRDPLLEHLAGHVTRGHGSALIDLRTTLVHSFSCRDDPRIAPWRHRNAEVHPDDRFGVLDVLARLVGGEPATVAVRIRFADNEPWTTVHAIGRPMTNYPRPQASIDFWLED